jgi:hypothetical protein
MAIDSQQLTKKGLYEGQGPLESLVNDIEGIEKSFEESATRRRVMRRVSGLWAIAAVICCIIAATTGDSIYFRFGGLPGFIVSIALFIHSFRYGGRLRYATRLELLKKLVGLVRQDADEQSPFSVRLSLASRPKLLSEAPWLERVNGKQQYLEEPWLSIEGRLLDGSILSEEVTQLSRRRTFMNPRGKTKTKTRSRFLVALRFAYPKDVYGDARKAQHALHEEIRVPGATTLRGVRINEKAIALKALTQTGDQIPQASAMLAMGAYRILNLARRAARPRGDAR